MKKRLRNKASDIVPCLKIVTATVLLLGLAVVGASAEDGGTTSDWRSGNLVVRGRLSGIVPYNHETSIDLIGGDVPISFMLLPDVDISFFLTDQWSITGQTGLLKTDIKIEGSIYGDINVGSVWTLPLSLSAQYHFPTDARLKPYVGAGLIANWYFGEKSAGGYVKNFTVSNAYAPMIKAGVDYQISENWFANLEVKQISLPAQTIENQGIRATTKLKTISVGFGFGYRF